MTERRVTRRAALKAGAGTGLAATLAGCLGGGSSSGNGDGPGGGGSLDAVPSGATAVVYLDTGQLLDGELVRQSVNRTLDLIAEQENATPPVGSYQELLSMAESEIGLDPTGLQSVQFFTSQMGSATGLLFDADWREDDIVSTIEGQGTVTLSSRSEDGHTIYSSEDGTDGLVALADGRYLLANRATIDSVLAVLAGDANSVGGELADAYAETSGMVRFAADVRDADLSDGEELSAAQDVTTVSGSLTGSGNSRTLSVTMSTTGSSSAEELAEQIDSLVTLAGSQLDQYPEVEEYIENPQDHLDAIDVSQSESAVTITYGGSVELVAEGGMLILGAFVASFFLGLGESTGSVAPQAAFAWDFDGESVTITHQGGDTIEGSNLYVRGDTGNGTIDTSWADSGVTEVTAGASITVQDVTGSYELDIVWVADDRGDSAILSRDTGPDA